MTLPTRSPIFATPFRRRFSRRVAAAMGSSTASVAASSASRFRARSPASSGLRHTMRRSPGQASLCTFTRFCSSNSDSCTAPASTSERIAGARRALIQSSPAGRTSSGSRPLVSIPRSPTSTTRDSPNRARSFSTCAPTAGRFPGVARAHLDRDRTPLPVAQQPDDDLQLAALAVPGVPPPRQRAGPALHPHRGQVIQDQGPVPEMPPGQAPLDPVLVRQQPVHRRIEVVLVHRPEVQGPGQRVPRGGCVQPPGGGRLRAGIEDPRGDHRQHPRPLRRPLGIEQLVEAEPADGAQHRRHMAVRQRADHVEGLVQTGHGGAALEQDAEPLDEGGGPPGEVGEGALANLAVLAEGLAQEDGGRGGPVGDRFDIHGYLLYRYNHPS